jgi:hypothetical protein
MEDPLIRRLEEWHQESQAAERRDAVRQRIWLRRMLFLLVTCCLAFALTTFWFSRLSASLSIEKADSQATSLVRAHFAALERGDYRTAYGEFSVRLRRRMPFRVFVTTIAGHWGMMSGQATVSPRASTPNRVVVRVNFAANEGLSLTAEFTLVRARGRWWIDNVSWTSHRVPHLIET